MLPCSAIPSRSHDGTRRWSGRSATMFTALLIVASACGGAPRDVPQDRPAGSATGPERRTVVAAQTPLLSDSTIPIARDRGWFDEVGIDIVVVEGRTLPALVPLLITGEVDVLYGPVSPAIATAIAQGSGVRMVVAGQVMDPDACPTYALLMLPDTTPRIDVTDPSALRDLRIGGPFEGGYLGLWFLEQLGARAGIVLDEIDRINVSTADAAATLAAGGVDAVLAAEPALTRIRQELGAEIVARVDEALPGKVLNGLFFGPRILEDPDLAARYLAVHLRAVAAHAEGPTERNVQVMSAATGLAPELLREVCWEQLGTDTLPHVVAIEQALDAAVRFGTLDVAPDSELFFDHSVGERARELLATSGVPSDG
jgi:ABC-type nitrate/sulfonate/bicarbonate transport system substrate-binding protein